ncbi:MFS transporter [Cellulomonas rhizosphaerae]|uniref:MFS transporter n=1 Tax=Cellulomonas rhizosphaerae TaxID=2293719 RepID=A0A413RPG5_9CELL|nr:MFS transporter [Cellulomonas rhizosphaerae]RHA43810.1 MFS transporter [Cellulomonas rhizosphaerae]
MSRSEAPAPGTVELRPDAAWKALRVTTWCLFGLIFLAAFEALAVTTVMPTVSQALDGADLYAFAFAGTLAAGVVGMVVSGGWADRRGPRGPLATAVALFATGLLLAGLAPSMELFVAGRLVQGLGAGGITVAVYVVVARAYPPLLHPRVFAGFSAAWVVPSLVGPPLAGAVAQHVGWRWVFLGVVAIVVPVALVVLANVARLGAPDEPAAGASGRRIAWACLAAVAVLGLNLADQADAPWDLVLAAAATVVVLIALRPLLPAGSLRLARGLPSVVSGRALLAGAFFGAEVYLPYLLTRRYDFSPTLAGVTLTAAAITWAGASWVQGRLAGRLGDRDAVRIGTVLVVVGVGSTCLVTAAHAPATLLVVTWACSGAGMGLSYARQTVLVLGYSQPGTQGTNSSSLTIADSTGAAWSLAVTGLVFGAASGLDGPFVATFAFTTLLAAGAALVAPRVASRGRQPATDASTART